MLVDTRWEIHFAREIISFFFDSVRECNAEGRIRDHRISVFIASSISRPFSCFLGSSYKKKENRRGEGENGRKRGREKERSREEEKERKRER